jgi:hypothetical protein
MHGWFTYLMTSFSCIDYIASSGELSAILAYPQILLRRVPGELRKSRNPSFMISVPSRPCTSVGLVYRQFELIKIKLKSKLQICCYFWELINVIFVMHLIRKSLPPRVAQASPVTAQKTPWLVHLHPRLRGNVGYDSRSPVVDLNRGPPEYAAVVR